MNKNQIISWRDKSSWLLFLFLGLNVVFININNSSDAYGYACDIQNGTSLFSPHHLLYNGFGYLIYHAFEWTNLGALRLMQIINIIAATFTLFFLYKLLHKFQINNIFHLMLIASFSFVFLRFSNENETYLLPLFFSMLATYLVFSQNLRLVFWGILFSVVAVLFHQIHIFWHISLMLYVVRVYKVKGVVLGILSVFIIFITYFIVAQSLHLKLWNFVLSDAKSGLVQLLPDFNNVKFFGVNFIRSFYQIHGEVFMLIMKYKMVLVCAISAAVLLVLSIIYLIKKGVFQKSNHAFKKERLTLILVFVMQAGFAFYSVGNAEFMTMLPLLLVIILGMNFTIKANKALLFLGVSMMVWNMSMYVIPHHALDFKNLSNQTEFVRRLNNSETVFVSKNAIELENYFCYTKIKFDKVTLLKIPAEMGEELFSQKMKLAFKEHKKVITDCLHNPNKYSRASIQFGEKNELYFKNNNYSAVLSDSIELFGNKQYFYEIKK